jgi:hypothetical protein
MQLFVYSTSRTALLRLLIEAGLGAEMETLFGPNLDLEFWSERSDIFDTDNSPRA